MLKMVCRSLFWNVTRKSLLQTTNLRDVKNPVSSMTDKSKVKGGLMFYLLSSPPTLSIFLPLNLQQEFDRPKARVTVLLSCFYSSMLVLRKQSLNYESTEGGFIHRPPGCPWNQSWRNIAHLYAVIVLKGSIHSKVWFCRCRGKG